MSQATMNESQPEPVRIRPGGGMVGLLLLTIGACSLAIGVLVQVLPGKLPALDKLVTERGIPASWFMILGAVFVGQFLLASISRAHAKALLKATSDCSSIRNLSVCVSDVHAAVDKVRQAQTTSERMLLGVQEAVQAMRLEAKNSKQKDAMFRMAASLDQLGARVDQRIEQTASSLHDSVFEVGSAVESSRDFVCDRVQQSLDSLAVHLVEELPQALPVSGHYAEPEPDSEPQSDSYSPTDLDPISSPDPEWERPLPREPYESEQESPVDGTMSVEIEHEEPPPIETRETHETHVDLGVLDQLEDAPPAGLAMLPADAAMPSGDAPALPGAPVAAPISPTMPGAPGLAPPYTAAPPTAPQPPPGFASPMPAPNPGMASPTPPPSPGAAGPMPIPNPGVAGTLGSLPHAPIAPIPPAPPTPADSLTEELERNPGLQERPPY